jgi:hypothetical protein
MKIMKPTQGIIVIKSHHPLLPVSCILLKLKPIPGRRMAKENKLDIQVGSSNPQPNIIPSRMFVGIEMRKVAKKNHQYSERDALPLKFA